ncbi:MAG TPA: MMPL family transporter [Ilumatobacteraceae bacterium]|nr:MMPL family transporter [Ilumatobacteraceae bacterium]
MTSTTPRDASGQPDESGRPYDPAHGAPHVPVEVPDSAWGKLGRFAFRRRWFVLGAWVTALVTVIALVGTIGASSDSSFSIPDSESKSGFDTLDEYFGGAGSGRSGSIVFSADQGVDDPEVQAAMTELFEEVDQIEGVTVISPYSPQGQTLGQVATDGDLAGQVAYARVDLDVNLSETRTGEIGAEIVDMKPSDIEGLQVEVGGQALGEFEPPESELIGLGFAIVILILSFGSVLAMGLPIGVALFGVGIGAGLITLLSNVISVPDFAVTLGAMIGIGVGIDYALFIVTRYREGLKAGLDPEQSTVVALDTAGRAVVFAGFTVVISLLGMYIMGLAFINGLATGAAVTVLVTMIASVTLLPALLGFAQRKIEVTRWRGIIAAGLVAVALVGLGLKIQPLLVGVPLAVVVLLASLVVAPLRKELPPRKEKPLRQTWAYKWSRFVQHRPWQISLATTAFLLLLSVPVLGLRLGFSDESNFAEGSTTREAYELTSEAFGPGTNGPLLLTAELSSPQDLQVLVGLTETLSATDGVADAVGPIPNTPQDPAAAQAAIIQLTPTTGPQDEATADLVNSLRNDVIPDATEGTGVVVNVSGSVAANIDFSSYLAQRIPIFFVAVLSLSFLLLMMVFRSVLVPLKAVIMNMLSIGGAYGIVVAVFGWGWGASLFNTAGGPIEPFLPMMMFAIVFGLSMDYEVFLLSRVKEEFDRTGDPKGSVADGLAATARVITAAAAIMIVVFAGFVLEDNRIIKMFGLGLASAVFLDATFVRMLLVPATMELLGARNWWLPKWLDRILPTLNVEGGTHTSAIALAHEEELREQAERDEQLVDA